MITKNDVHTIIIDTDNWKPGMSFCDAKFSHLNCGAKSQARMSEELPLLSAQIHCWNCKVNFTFFDWSFLLTFVEHRPIIYYQNGKILRLFHKCFLMEETSITYKEPCEIKVRKRNKDRYIHFDQIKIIHQCEPLPCAIHNWGDYYEVPMCGMCHQKFDFNNLDLLIAVFNASLHNASTEVTTVSGKVLVKPMKSRKE
jgi:hypothetical protein